jgi:tryptophan synthase alpha chain
MTKKAKVRVEGRIEARFKALGERGEKALITFVTAGDPDLKTTRDIVLEMERAGADVIELGIPFSDPMADGPTIQASSERALRAGTKLKDVLDIVSEIRRTSEVPIVLFGYYNPIFVYGPKRFARDARRAGADGALVVDLPPEEADELHSALREEGLDLIFLLTPTSDVDRMKLVAGKASGFVYYVSVTGVTGARRSVSGSVKSAVARVRRHTGLPVGVGFGVSRPEHVAEICRFADGAVVGSAIIDLIKEHGPKGDAPERVARFVHSLKGGTRQ